MDSLVSCPRPNKFSLLIPKMRVGQMQNLHREEELEMLRELRNKVGMKLMEVDMSPTTLMEI